MKHLSKWNEMRRRKAEIYNNLLGKVEGIQIRKQADYAKHVYHLYVIRTLKKDELIASFSEKDISCGIHYPIPIHFQKAYGSLGPKK